MRHSFAATVLHFIGIILLLQYDGVTLFICDSEWHCVIVSIFHGLPSIIITNDILLMLMVCLPLINSMNILHILMVCSS